MNQIILGYNKVIFLTNVRQDKKEPAQNGQA